MLQSINVDKLPLDTCILVPEFSVYNPWALFRKSLSNNIDFLNSALGLYTENSGSTQLLQMCILLHSFTEEFRTDFSSLIRTTAVTLYPKSKLTFEVCVQKLPAEHSIICVIPEHL